MAITSKLSIILFLIVGSQSFRLNDLPPIDNHIDSQSTSHLMTVVRNGDGTISEKIINDPLTDPCLTHYCTKGRECYIRPEDHIPDCQCQRHCTHRRRLICGTDGMIYENHCELHRAACLMDRTIAYQRLDKCVDQQKGSENETTSKCSDNEWERLKDNLLLYSHSRLMSQDNSHSKDFLISIMFSHYDLNNDGHLEAGELQDASLSEHLEKLSDTCRLADMLLFDDHDHDERLTINEFYQAFNKLYNKALEMNRLAARVGDNVEIKCDVMGQPAPPIVWQRNQIDLTTISMEDVRVFNDGSLYLTQIQLRHAGNYTCHAQRNKDVVQTHILTVHTIPTVHVMPRIQSRRPGEMARIRCHATGEPFPHIVWLKNDERIDVRHPIGKYEIVGNGTALKIKNITYSDTGAYMCQATNRAAAIKDISSLVVQEEPTPTAIYEAEKFFVFHAYGIAIYESTACRLYHQIHGSDIIPGTQQHVCDVGIPLSNETDLEPHQCSWGEAINIDRHYIYVTQPEMDRILILSTIQMVIVDVIGTDSNPVNLYWIPPLDQVWILNWRDIESKTIQVIRGGSQKRKHYTVHPEPIDGQFDRVDNLYIPFSRQTERSWREHSNFNYKYGYVTHPGQQSVYKLDLAAMRYVRSVDLSGFNCLPDRIAFSALYGFVIISCRDPGTNHKRGQLVMDSLTDSILSVKPTLIGWPILTPDSRHCITIDNSAVDGLTTLVVQRITETGLDFLFDVKTTFNISDVTFFDSQTVSGYDLYASASNKEDILYLNLNNGKVKMITGVGPSNDPVNKWEIPVRPIRASVDLFGRYLVTPSKYAIYVLNGRERTINCEIGGVANTTTIVWSTDTVRTVDTVRAPNEHIVLPYHTSQTVMEYVTDVQLNFTQLSES